MPQPTDTANAPQQKRSTSTADMLAALQEADAAEAQETQEGADSEASEAGDAEAAREREAASPEGEGNAEATDDDAEARADGEDAEESGKDAQKRPSRSTLVKRRLQERVKGLEQTERDLGAKLAEVVEIANVYRADGAAKDATIEALKAELKRRGWEEDPRDLELADARRKLSEREMGDKIAQARKEHELKAHAAGRKSEMVREFVESSETLGEKYALDPLKLRKAFAIALEAAGDGEDEPTMEDVAKTLAPLQKVKTDRAKHDAAREQHQATQGAPAPIRGQGVARPKFTTSTKDMAAFARSLGD